MPSLVMIRRSVEATMPPPAAPAVALAVDVVPQLALNQSRSWSDW
jgi:hypothetical protein